MSSTNHTTNYNLPQFLGSDKPAWLGDINPAFSVIDTQMKANDTKAQKGVDDASTAKSRADDAYTLADGAKTDAGTAQGTANQAIAGVSTVSTALNNFMLKFNLSNISQGNNSGTTTTGQVNNGLTLAQNSDGSIFKMYGYHTLVGAYVGTSTATRKAIPGLTGYYGVDAGLTLLTAPTQAYIVKGAGIQTNIDGNGTTRWGAEGCDFAVGTDGKIYVRIATNSGSASSLSNTDAVQSFVPALYFNSSFGDEPTPES